MRNLPVLSLIIVNYRTPDLTLLCVESIYKFPPSCSFEVIVVDNGSSDGLEETLAERFPEARFLETGKNTGFSIANNLGIQNCHGEQILLMNSDARFVDRSLDKMLEVMGSEPEVGILGLRQVNAQGVFQLSCGVSPNLVAELVRKIWHYRLSADDYRVRDYLDVKFAQNHQVDWVSGSCMMVRREVFRQVRLLDERYFMYYEDIDFCVRARKAGWKVRYLNECTIIHEVGASARQNLLKAMVENKRSQLYFSRRHYGLMAECAVRAALFLKYAFYLAQWGGLYMIRRLLGKDLRYTQTMALLAKKTIQESLTRAPAGPWTPRLVHDRIRRPEEGVLSPEEAVAADSGKPEGAVLGGL